MFSSLRTRQTQAASAMVDITPMVDIVFILLFFFLVTASFVQDTGVSVEKPLARESRALDAGSYRVGITASGNLFAEGRPIRLEDLRDRLTTGGSSGQPIRSVIVIPDVAATAGRLIEVMDTVRAAGIADVAVATETPPHAGR